MDVLNLSIGGPDYLDLPFVEKARDDIHWKFGTHVNLILLIIVVINQCFAGVGIDSKQYHNGFCNWK